MLTKRAAAYNATEQWDLATADLSRALQDAPATASDEVAEALDDLLLVQAEKSAKWTVLTPAEAAFEGGATLTVFLMEIDHPIANSCNDD